MDETASRFFAAFNNLSHVHCDDFLIERGGRGSMGRTEGTYDESTCKNSAGLMAVVDFRDESFT